MNDDTSGQRLPPLPPLPRGGTYAPEEDIEEQLQPTREEGWPLVVMWVLAVTAATFVNVVLKFGLYGFLLPALPGDRFVGPDLQFTLIELTDNLLTGATLGLLQWLVLRRYVEGIAWWTWTATAVGANVLSFLLIFGVRLVVPWAVASLGSSAGAWTSMLSVAASQLYPAVVLSLLRGGLQWLILRRHLRGAGLWVPAEMAGALLGTIAGLIPFLSLQELSQYDNLGLLPLMIFVITTPLSPCIPGFTLQWMVNNTRRRKWTYETP
jgi:hypothetical protein